MRARSVVGDPTTTEIVSIANRRPPAIHTPKDRWYAGGGRAVRPSYWILVLVLAMFFMVAAYYGLDEVFRLFNPLTPRR